MQIRGYKDFQVRDRDRDENEMTKQSKEIQKAAQLSKARNAVIPKTSDFRSIRMRLSPSLVAPCVGTIPRGAPLSYIEEVENDDGKWLRLTDETAALFGYNSCGEQVALFLILKCFQFNCIIFLWIRDVSAI